MKGQAPHNVCSDVDDRIDEQCDAFESACRSGDRPNIRDFINTEDLPYRNELFRELLLVDIEWRRSLGEKPTTDNYLRAFPEFAAQIDAVTFLHGKAAFSISTVRAAAQATARKKGSQVAHLERVGVLERSRRWIGRHPVTTAATVLAFAAILATSATIAPMNGRDRRAAGFLPVHVTTTPRGARLAIVPLDPNTNEPYPDPAGIVRPPGTTPLTTELKAGTYLVEAVLPGDSGPLFIEAYRTVPGTNVVSESLMRANKKSGLPPDTVRFLNIEIALHDTRIEKMVQITIPEDLRAKHPSLPAKLYVDAKQTTAAELASQAEFDKLLDVTNDGAPYIPYRNAINWAERNQTRLPSAAEYDAIVAVAKQGNARLVGTGEPVEMADLFDDIPEFSNTIATEPGIGGQSAALGHLHGMHVLKGFIATDTEFERPPWSPGTWLVGADTESWRISIRGVRSATPRFAKP